MSYAVKELYYTLQGEGYHTGRAAVFLRFAGCNLWSGREEDRADAICDFCDTDFVGVDGPGGGRYPNAETLAAAAAQCWAARPGVPFVVMTGGEPLLQVDHALLQALHRHGFEIAVETNGTVKAPEAIDWICVSPKAGAPFVQRRGNELKLVYPQRDLDPSLFEGLPFYHFYLQPKDGPDRERNTVLAVAYCQAHPRWRLSVQTHKVVGIR